MSASRVTVNLASQTSYLAQNAPDVNCPFEPKFIRISLETGDGCTVSFDGVEDHVPLSASAPSIDISYVKIRKIWFKASAAATASVLMIN